MTQFVVNVTIDPAELERKGKRHGFSLERANSTLLADIECTLFDVLRYKAGVANVGVTVVEPKTAHNLSASNG